MPHRENFETSFVSNPPVNWAYSTNNSSDQCDQSPHPTMGQPVLPQNRSLEPPLNSYQPPHTLQQQPCNTDLDTHWACGVNPSCHPSQHHPFQEPSPIGQPVYARFSLPRQEINFSTQPPRNLVSDTHWACGVDPCCHSRPRLPITVTSNRRKRMKFAKHQTALLERFFSTTCYPKPSTREALAVNFNVDEDVIAVWFKNRRAKQRKLSRQVE